MKKILTAMLCMSLGMAHAQTVGLQKTFSELHGFGGISKSLTVDGKPYLYGWGDTDTGEFLVIFDSELNVTKKIMTKGNEPEVLRDFCNYDTGETVPEHNYTVLSQTLFNSDAKWEYLAELEEGYALYNEDGKELLRFPDYSFESCFVLGGKVWMIFEDGYDLVIYRIDPGTSTNKISAVPVTPSDEAYTLVGTLATKHNKGVIIQNGKKTLRR